MSCRIIEDPRQARPYAWRRAGAALLAASDYSGVPAELAAAESPELNRRISDLERRHEAEIARAREAALREGQSQGREQALAELAPVIEKFAATAAELAGLRRKVRNEAEADVVRLALAIARRILHRELSIDASAIHGLVHAALEKLQNREVYRVRAHPAFTEAIGASLKRIGAAPAIEVVADNSLIKGAAIFETALGELDASIDVQLQEIERGFADRLDTR